MRPKISLFLTASLLTASACVAEAGIVSSNVDLRTGPSDAATSQDAQTALVDASSLPDSQATELVDGGSGRPDSSWDGSSVQWDSGGCGASTLSAEKIIVEKEVVTEHVTEEILPVALYIALDQSVSMDWGNLWGPAKNAIKSFVNDPASAGLDVALEFFPEAGGQCNGAGYNNPVVAMGRLPDHASSLASELDRRPSAGGIGTPIEGALRGATSFCTSFQASSGGEKCVAVLITDGEPLGCDGFTNNLAAIAQSAYAGGSGVRTFAVGLAGADFNLLDAIANAGGAVDCDESGPRFACDVSRGPSELSAALSRIRDVVQTVERHVEIETSIEEVPLDCEWAIPESSTFDPAQVNVRLSAPSLSEPIGLGHVPGPTSCAAAGWHYDDPDAPSRLIACPETCDFIRATPAAQIDILLGCPTIVL